MKKLIALIALLAAFPPLSTDMYLAAIPLLMEKWQQPLATLNLTLVCFFVSYCFFLLFYGPLSDRYGRKPPLIYGLSLYIVASILCSAANSVELMIIARTIQGAGAAAASAIAFAICKDMFEGRLRQRIFLQLGVIVAAAPMIAPIIGGWIIEHYSWRWVFILKAIMGTISLAGVLAMKESLQEVNTDKLSAAVSSYLRLTQNKQYLYLVVISSVLGCPFFAFIASSSDLYISTFGFSEQQYGIFFALNASAFMIAPLLFGLISKKLPLTVLLPISYSGVLISSLLMFSGLLPGHYGLTIPMWALTFSFAFGRPPGNNLILEQVDKDVGAASSFMVFTFFLGGSISMWIISQDWHDKLLVLSIFGILSASITLLGWLIIRKTMKLKLV